MTHIHPHLFISSPTPRLRRVLTLRVSPEPQTHLFVQLRHFFSSYSLSLSQLFVTQIISPHLLASLCILSQHPDLCTHFLNSASSILQKSVAVVFSQLVANMYRWENFNIKPGFPGVLKNQKMQRWDPIFHGKSQLKIGSSFPLQRGLSPVLHDLCLLHSTHPSGSDRHWNLRSLF